jgi:radical SAM superfamily enzyme YgiQ (UPF0313 family)
MINKIALINVKSDIAVHPLSLLYVGTALKKAGFEVEIYNITPDKIESEINEILAQDHLFVGFSVFTGMHTAVAAELSQQLKERNPSTVIVWGGIHPSLVPRQCLEEDFVDIVAIGEGEETAVELALALRDGRQMEFVKGIGFKSGDKIIMNEPRPLIDNLDACELDWSLVNIGDCIEITNEGIRNIPYITSRGCPFNCGFCYNLAFNKRKWRPLSFERVIRDIAHLKKISGINGIVFNDDNFMVDRKRALKILKFLQDNGIKCLKLEMRLDLLDERFLDEVQRLGVNSIFVGWESGSNRILKLINKGITREGIIEKMRLFSLYPQMKVIAAGIIGFPTETWQETCQTIDVGVKIAELVPSNTVTFQTFLPYPGTDLYPLAVREGFEPPRQAADWAGFNTFYGEMKLEWLPWATKTTPRVFYRIDKYGKLLSHGPSTSFLRTLGKKLCYFCAKLRLRFKFFYFPLEIFVLHRFNRYYLDSKKNFMLR